MQMNTLPGGVTRRILNTAMLFFTKDMSMKKIVFLIIGVFVEQGNSVVVIPEDFQVFIGIYLGIRGGIVVDAGRYLRRVGIIVYDCFFGFVNRTGAGKDCQRNKAIKLFHILIVIIIGLPLVLSGVVMDWFRLGSGEISFGYYHYYLNLWCGIRFPDYSFHGSLVMWHGPNMPV